MRKISIMLREDQLSWLESHEEISTSGLMRKLLDEYVAVQKEHNSSLGA